MKMVLLDAALSPQPLRLRDRIDAALLPTCLFIANRMQRPMVRRANRDGPFIAHLPPDRAGLGEPQMMRLARRAPADKARLECHKSQMLFVANPERRADREDRLIDLGHILLGFSVGALGMPILIERTKLPLIELEQDSSGRFNDSASISFSFAKFGVPEVEPGEVHGRRRRVCFRQLVVDAFGAGQAIGAFAPRSKAHDEIKALARAVARRL